ncbi:MAG TPA: AEC family transporter [Azospirillaceae bacterium]|nr:AEC family transporter [Azospirillaceae bacterium]
MSVVFNVALPIFTIVLAGYLAGAFGLLGREAPEIFDKFVYWIALPPILFLGTARHPPEVFFYKPFIFAFLGSALVVFTAGAALGWLLHRERPGVMCLQGLTASFSNTGYIGIPLFLAAFGSTNLGPPILATVVLSGGLIAVSIILLELSRNLRKGFWLALATVLMALLTNPLIVAPALGLMWSTWASTVAMPPSVVNLCELLGAAAGPCALFSVGLFLSTHPIETDWNEIGWITALKLLWQPVLTWFLADHVFFMEPFWMASAVILSALPTGGLTYVVAEHYGTYTERNAAVIVVSTLLSVIPVSALLVLYGGV